MGKIEIYAGLTVLSNLNKCYCFNNTKDMIYSFLNIEFPLDLHIFTLDRVTQFTC